MPLPGLENPFALSTDPRFFFRSHSHGAAFDDLIAGIRRREGIVLLTGDAGAGKTTLCRSVLNSLDPSTLVAFVTDPIASREDLLSRLLVGFGLVSAAEMQSGHLREASRTELSLPLYKLLTSMAGVHEVGVVIIDEAHELSVPLLEEIRILSDMEGKQKLLQLVLVGEPAIQRKLAMPELRQLTQRLSVRRALEPLSRRDLGPYLSHRLSVTGNIRAVHFSEDAIDLIHATSHGNPRQINVIAERAFARVFGAGRMTVMPEDARDAINGVELPANLDTRPAKGDDPALPAVLVPAVSVEADMTERPAARRFEPPPPRGVPDNEPAPVNGLPPEITPAAVFAAFDDDVGGAPVAARWRTESLAHTESWAAPPPLLPHADYQATDDSILDLFDADEPSALREEPSALRFQEPTAFKGEPSAFKFQEPTTLKEEPSALKFQEPTALKEEPSALKFQEPTALQEEPSALKFQEPTALKEEPSALKFQEATALKEEPSPFKFQEPTAFKPVFEEVPAIRMPPPLVMNTPALEIGQPVLPVIPSIAPDRPVEMPARRSNVVIGAIALLSIIAIVQSILLFRGMGSRAPAAAAPGAETVTSAAPRGAAAALPSAGTIAIQSTPAGATIAVNGQARGVTPATLTLAPGDYKIDIARAGVSRQVPVTVTAGSSSTQHILFGGPTQGLGGLQVSSQPPGARITVDGIPRGFAPLTVSNLTPGSHIVVLDGPSGSTRQTVTVQPGVNSSLTATMPAAGAVAGWVRVSAPVDVQLFENGALLGSSQSERIMLPAGRHVIQVINNSVGYSETRTVQIMPGSVASLTLDVPPGSVDINAQPWAEVSIGGRNVGTTPLGNVSLPVGTQEIVFRHPQLGERRQTITVTLKGPNRLSVNMNQR